MPNPLPEFGAFTRDGEGNYYFFYAKAVPEEDKDAGNMMLVKCDPNGRQIKTFTQKASAGTNNGMHAPFNAGSCRLELSGGLLAVHFARTMFKSADGLNHQASYGFIVDKETLTLFQPSTVYVSHSFNQYILPLEGGFLVVDHGDSFPRAFNFYKTAQGGGGNVMSFTFPGKGGDNYTGAEMGAAVKTPQGFLFVGAYAKDKNGEGAKAARNLFTLAIDEDAKECGAPSYLTSYTYSDRIAVHPKLVALDRGRYLLLWETYRYNAIQHFSNLETSYLTTYMQYLDGKGKALGAPQELVGLRLNEADVPRYNPVTTRVYWAVSGSRTRANAVTLYGLDVSGAPAVAYTPPKPLAGEALPARAPDDMALVKSAFSNDYYIGVHEVTWKEWHYVMGKYGAFFLGFTTDLYQAATLMSWYDAAAFCNAKSKKEGLTPAYTINGKTVTWNKGASGYRLPTAWEWQFAARGGYQSKGYVYSGGNDKDAVGWQDGKVHQVGGKAPNELGLYDMSGNVQEWCWDEMDGWRRLYSGNKSFSDNSLAQPDAVGGGFRLALGSQGERAKAPTAAPARYTPPAPLGQKGKGGIIFAVTAGEEKVVEDTGIRCTFSDASSRWIPSFNGIGNTFYRTGNPSDYKDWRLPTSAELLEIARSRVFYEGHPVTELPVWSSDMASGSAVRVIRFNGSGKEALGTAGPEDECFLILVRGGGAAAGGGVALTITAADFASGAYKNFLSSAASVVIDGNVKTIPARAFQGCTTPASITIPPGVTSIGDEAFQRCGSLVRVTLPAGLKTIGQGAFQDCAALSDITIPPGVTAIGEGAFYRCAALASLAIPASVTVIEPYAFRNCTALTKVTVAEGLKTIGYDAFADCAKLSSIVLPVSVEAIGGGAFEGCPLDGASAASVAAVDVRAADIASRTVSENDFTCAATADGKGVVITEYKGKATIVAIPPSIGGKPVREIGEYAFKTKQGFKVVSVTIPTGVTVIGKYAFQQGDLVSVTIPPSVTTIEGSAFSACLSLTEVNLPGVTTLGDRVFANCTALKKALIPGVTAISQRLFQNCKALQSIVIPPGVTSIGLEAFQGCSALASVSIPASVTLISGKAFQNCAALKRVTIPASVKTVAASAFGGCALDAASAADITARFGKAAVR
jgi:hypothetical protein